GGTGNGMTVAVIDGPIDPTVPELRGRIASTRSMCLDPDELEKPRSRPSTAAGEEAEHATSMASLIAGSGAGTGPGGRGIRGIAPQATIRHYAAMFEDAGTTTGRTCGIRFPDSNDVEEGIAVAIEAAARDDADVISISLVSGYSQKVVDALLTAYREGAVVVAGTSNRTRDTRWPGLGNGVVLVNPVGEDSKVTDFAVPAASSLGLAAPGEDVMAATYDETGWHSEGLASGSSISTAIVSGGIAAVWSAHPRATGAQVLQAVRQNVGLRATTDGSGYQTWWRRIGSDLPQVRTKNAAYGWGIFDPADAVRVDPTTLEDVNPFIREGGAAEPTAEEIELAFTSRTPRTASASPAVSPSPSRSASAVTGASGQVGDAGEPVLPWAVGGSAALVLVLLGGFALARRSPHASTTEPPPDPAVADVATTTVPPATTADGAPRAREVH
ncbi:MAG: S8/S53 family peptidase, partial [Ornithinibacter sp.]